MGQRFSTGGLTTDLIALATLDEAARSQGQRSSERRKKWFSGPKEEKKYEYSIK